jgi:hypothetical protein
MHVGHFLEEKLETYQNMTLGSKGTNPQKIIFICVTII